MRKSAGSGACFVVMAVWAAACSEHVPIAEVSARPPPSISPSPDGPPPRLARTPPSERVHIEEFGRLTTHIEPTIPISGGTLLTRSDGHFVASQPELDRVWWVHAETGPARIDLRRGDEPGRMAEDRDGRVHVVLRRGGEIATLENGEVVRRTPTCVAPRGIAYQPDGDLLVVACLSGRLEQIPAGGGEARLLRTLRPDLRDVVVEGENIWVSVFRKALVLRVDSSGVTEHPLPITFSPRGNTMTPFAAWRMRAHPLGGVAVLYQRGANDPVSVQSLGYGPKTGRCEGTLIHTVLARIQADHPALTTEPLESVTLAVDFDIRPDGTAFAVADARAHGEAGFWLEFAAEFQPPIIPHDYVPDPQAAGFHRSRCVQWHRRGKHLAGIVVAVAYDANSNVGSQSMGNATIKVARTELITAEYQLGTPASIHTGHRMFHTPLVTGLACASCHPEGGDDGRVWNFQDIGPRRTQTLRGGLLGTEPFHWDGDMSDLKVLLHRVMSDRMGGIALNDDYIDAFGEWLQFLEHPASPAGDPDAIERGRLLFEDSNVGCAGCHAGDKFTNNLESDVGTGGRFQVPSLTGLRFRAPYMHNGCAETLPQRFTKPECGGGDVHGKTSHLSESEIADLVLYLESL